MYAAVCRALLRLYPPAFRVLQGEEVVLTMQQRFTDAHVRGGTSEALWYATRDLADLVAGAVVARWRGWRTRGGRSGSGVWRRETRGMSVLQDVLYAFRGMRRDPAYTAIIVLTLGVGIGANTAIFSVLNAVLLRPLAYEEPEQLVVIWDRFDRIDTRTWVHDLQVRRLREQATMFDGFASVHMVSGRILGGDRPVHTNVGRTSYDFFDVLGVEPQLGRTFREGDDVMGAPWVVILTYEYWQREFGGDPDVIGTNIVVGFPQMEIIGVRPPGPRSAPRRRRKRRWRNRRSPCRAWAGGRRARGPAAAG